MRARRRSVWPRLGIAALVLTASALGLVYLPGVVREASTFRVQRVEVVGTRFVQPYAVVEAAGIGPESNLFEPRSGWSDGVMALPLIESVRVRRQLPGTVVVEVREVTPVALVAGAELRPVDASGRLLPLELAGVVVDLPILVGVAVAGGELAGVAGRAALHALLELSLRHSELADRVSQVEVGADLLRLVFRDDGPDALLPVSPSETQLMQLRVAYADLVARGELSSARRIDVRFRDQVVVSFLRTPVS